MRICARGSGTLSRSGRGRDLTCPFGCTHHSGVSGSAAAGGVDNADVVHTVVRRYTGTASMDHFTVRAAVLSSARSNRRSQPECIRFPFFWRLSGRYLYTVAAAALHAYRTVYPRTGCPDQTHGIKRFVGNALRMIPLSVRVRFHFMIHLFRCQL